MTTDAIVRLILGIFLLSLFFPTAYFAMPDIVRWIIVIIGAVVGIKLILDAVNQI